MVIFDTFQEILRFFPHAVLAGVIIGPVCALLGIFTILKRVVFIGITLSEVAACGVALAILHQFNPFVGAAALSLSAVILLSYPFETQRISRDAILGAIFVCASAVSVLLVSGSGFELHEVRRLLYGDLILTSPDDFRVIMWIFIPVLLFFLLFLRPTLNSFLDREYSKIINIRVTRWEILYFLSLGLAVSAASKVAGSLLIFCYLVVAPGAALLLTRNIYRVMAFAALGALLPTIIGLYVSYRANLPTNQTIILMGAGWFFVVCLVVGFRRMIYRLWSRRDNC